MRDKFDLNTVLIDFGDGSPGWTIREAVEGVQIFGGIGSGKSTGSGRMIALKYLSEGFGGLVLTAKPDEKDTWTGYCKLTGRSDDLIIIEPESPHIFNFLEYETAKTHQGRSITENIVQVLKTVIRAGEEKASGKSDDPFWETALDMLIFNVIDLCLLAYGRVTVQDMYEIVLSAPKPNMQKDNETAYSKAFNIAKRKYKEAENEEYWKLSVTEAAAITDADGFVQWIMEVLPMARSMKFVDDFFNDSYKHLAEKTRSIIEFSFSGFLFRLLKDPVYSLFCNKPSTVKPDLCIEGKIILVNLPVKLFHKVGRDCQILFKYIWQRAMERREITPDSRPVFLFADEAQNFLHEYDAEYQATARSSRIATVYISQNIPNYYAMMGGSKSEQRVKGFLGTLGTKIFHSNADIETNNYASDLIGQAYTEDGSSSSTMSDRFSMSQSESYKLEKMIRPEKFIGLQTGGRLNNMIVEGFMHRQSYRFGNGLSFKKIRFNQEYTIPINNHVP